MVLPPLPALRDSFQTPQLFHTDILRRFSKKLSEIETGSARVIWMQKMSEMRELKRLIFFVYQRED